MPNKLAITALAAAVVFALPAAAAHGPTNSSAAFKTIGLYADRATAANTSDHLNFSGYPSTLASPPPLVVTRPTPGSADTMALFNSFAKDATYFEVNGSQPQSFATYAATPPQYATSLGSLLMGVNIYHGFNTFNDYGKELVAATATYVDGDTSVVRFHAYGEVRDYWDSGPLNCGGLQYIMNDRPFDPLTAYIYETGGQYFDAQETRLPRNRRGKRVASITLAGTYLPHSCGVFAGSRLAGLTVWSNFRLAKSSGADSVARQSQTTGHNHGGYLFSNDVVGWRRHTDETGCKITSLAVAYTYSGFNCSVDSLNAFLQRSQGYKPSQVCVVQSVAADGSSVTFTPLTQDDTRLKITDTFLIERGIRSNPLATYQVDAAGHATRIARYNNSVIPVRGDVGRVYWNSIPEIADKYTHPGLRSKYVPDTPQAAAIVESLLVRDIPVQLNVGPKGGHWVVADGMTSSFRPDGTAAGTYSIKDPYDPRNYTKLIQGQYANVFTQARYLEPTGLPLPSSPFSAASDPAGLSVLADGAWRVEIIDPLGRHMMRDATTGEGIYDIPDASIEDVSSEHDNGAALTSRPRPTT